MHIATGYFDSTGTPRLKISLRGTQPLGTDIDAILDTGFTGFLQVPLLQAFPVGLALAATTPMTYANGTTAMKLMAWGTVLVGAKQATGLVVLEENPCDVLLGMGFLGALNARLVMTKDVVSIMEADWVEQLAKLGAEAQGQQQAKPETQSPAASVVEGAAPQEGAQEKKEAK